MANILNVGVGETYSTIQAAINAAGTGDTIIVDAGTYTENLIINKAVTIDGAHAGDAGTANDRDATGASGETTIIGHSKITATDGAVTIDGVVFVNDATTTNGGPNNPTLQITSAEDHVITNSVFYSTVTGGTGGSNGQDRAISLTGIASGDITVSDNYFTGSHASAFGGASWGSAVWSDGGGAQLDITDNTFENVRTGLNLNVDGTSQDNVDGNTFHTVGSGISVGPTDNDNLTVGNNTFHSVGDEFNFRNVPTDVTFDAETHVETVVADGTSNDVVSVLGGGGNDTLSGTEGDDFIDGNNLSASHVDNDIISGRGGNDTLKGEAGDDSITGGAGNDSIDGGTGTDTANYTTTLSSTNFSSSGGQWVVNAGTEGTDHLVNVEQVADGSGHHVLLVGNGGYAHIQDAINAAHSGDTILVAAGTYQENLTITTDGITIEGKGAVTIEGTFKSTNGISDGGVADFLKSGHSYTQPGDKISVNADNVTIKGVTVDGYTFGVSLEDGATGTTLTDVNFTDNLVGIHKGTSATISDFTMTGGSISDSLTGIDFDKSLAPADRAVGTADGVTIDGTDFNNIVYKGAYFEALSNAHLTNITMEDVGQFGAPSTSGTPGTSGNGIDLNLKNGDYSNIEIDNFHLTDTGASNQDGAATGSNLHDKNGGAIVVEARDTGSYATAQGHVTDTINIHDGTIDGTTSTGIQVGEPGQANTHGPAVTVSNVTIRGAEHNSDAANGGHGDITNVTASVLTVNGTAGDDTYVADPLSTGDIVFNGGGGNDSFTGGAEHDTATYSTTLSASSFSSSGGHWNVAAGAEGTDHLTNVEEVTDGAGHHILLVGNGGYATIQAAINAATDGDIIEVAAGTYTENLNINKSVTIDGAHAGDAGTDGDRDVTGASGETTIIGHSKITASTGAVTIDGVVFINDSTTTHGGAGNPTLQITSGEDHVVTNSIFYSTAVGGANGVLDRAISLPGIADGDITISDNYFTGSHASGFSGASWGSAVWSDGGGAQLDITGNTFEYVRTGLNLNLDGTSQDNVDGNTFHTAGSGISVGPTDNDQLTVGDNTFHSVGDEFNFRNVPTDVTFDAEAHVETVVTDGTSNDVVSVLGGGGNDTLSGTEGSDFIDGNNLSTSHVDNDTIDGRGGDDLLMGEAGDDGITGGAGNDTISGGTGKDTAHYSGTLTASDITYDATNSVWDVDASGSGEGHDVLSGMEVITDNSGNTFVLVGGDSEFTSDSAATTAHPGATVLHATPGPIADTDGTANSVAEDAASGTVVHLTAHANDVGGGAVTYSLTDDANGAFQINATTGIVTVADGTQIDYENSGANHQIDITVEATNSVGGSNDTVFHIGVTDVAPTLVASLGPVSEGTQSVGNVAGPGDTNSVSYSIVPNADGADFTINDQGNLSFVNKPDFENPIDQGSDNTYHVNVLAFDNGNTVIKGYDITVTDAPLGALTDSIIAANHVAEGADTGTAVAGLAISATDGAGPTTYSLTDDDNGAFQIDATTGVVTVLDGSKLDFETSQSEMITVEASAGTSHISQTFTIGIDNVTGQTINGSSGNDDINGTHGPNGPQAGTALATSEADTIHGGAGNDVIDGLAGDDTITGDAGNDTLIGGAGNDNLTGGAGKDNVSGGADNDTIHISGTNDLTDIIDGGDGTNTIVVDGNGNVTLTAFNDSGADNTDIGVHEIQVWTGNGVGLLGTAAANVFDFTGVAVTGLTVINTAAGNDTVIIDGADTNGYTLIGGAGVDSLTGGAGDDTITGGTGADVLDGGAGNNTASYAGSTVAVNVSLLSGLGTGGDAAGDTLSNIQNLIGSAKNDTLTGDVNDNVLTGGAGVDHVSGGAGDDTIHISGSGDASDVIDGGADDDTIAVDGAGNVTLAAFNDSAALDTAIGIHNIEVWDGNGAVLLGTAGNNVFDFTGVAVTDLTVISTAAGNDTVTIDSADTNGYTLIGGAGVDSLTGGAGDDTIIGGIGADTIKGGAGNNTASYSGSTVAVNINLDLGTASGGDAAGDTLTNIQNLIGSAKNDTLTGDVNDNVLTGGAGVDHVSGGAGDDTIVISGTNDTKDTIDGGSGGETDGDTLMVAAGTGTVTLAGFKGTAQHIENFIGDGAVNGTAGADVFDFTDVAVSGVSQVNGGAGNDIITAGDDDLRMIGGAGKDTITGGAGDDTIVVSSTNDITDVINGGGGTNTLEVAGIANLTLNGFDAATQSIDIWQGNGHELLGTSAANTFDLSGLTSITALSVVDAGSGDDTIVGNDTVGLNLRGGAGDDMITAGNHGDTLTGGAGTDQLVGGTGDDTFIISGTGDSSDTFSGGGGTDTIKTTGAVTLAGFNAASDSIESWSGTVNASLTGTAGGVTFDLSNLTHVDHLSAVIGGSGADVIIGSDAWAGDLRGGSGADTLTGGMMNDKLTGNAGADTFVASHGNDTIMDFTVASKTTVSATDDHIDVSIAHFANDTALDSAMSQVGKNVSIDLGGGDHLTVDNTTIAILQAHHSDFHL